MNRIGKIVGGAAIFLIVVAVAVPNLLSTKYVKQRIADQLSQLLGRDVAINGSSSISMRPYLGVVYNDVTISDDGDAPNRPLVAMEGLKAKLDFLSAMWGEAKFVEVEFVRPQFNLHITQDGARNWHLESGEIAKQIADESSSGSLALGTIKISDGIFELNDESSRTTNQLTSINGVLTWPKLDSSANGRMNAVWQGEVMDISVSLATPLQLLRNGQSETSIKLNSKPANLTFDGTMDSAASSMVGTLGVSTPSPKRFAEWLSIPSKLAAAFEETTVSGPVTIKTSVIEFEEVDLKIGTHTGRGRLQFSKSNSSLFDVLGTLAFDTMSLEGFENLLDLETRSEAEEVRNLGVLNEIEADLRLSANTVIASQLEISNLAASIMVKDGKASLDVGQAETMGGILAGSLSIEAKQKSISLASDFLFSEIDFEQLTKVYRENGFSLAGQGSMRLKVKSTAASPNQLISRLNGEGSINGDSGELIGLDLESILAKSQNEDGSLSRISNSSTDYTLLTLKFFIANGTAFFRGSELTNDSIKVNINGRSDLDKRTLALRGQISEVENETGLPFFIGGTISSPLFVPLSNFKRPPEQTNDLGQPAKEN